VEKDDDEGNDPEEVTGLLDTELSVLLIVPLVVVIAMAPVWVVEDLEMLSL